MAPMLSACMPGDLAQLARASALQAEGQGFKSPNLQLLEKKAV